MVRRRPIKRFQHMLEVAVPIISTSAIASVAVYVSHSELPIWLAVVGFVGISRVHDVQWQTFAMTAALIFFTVLAIAAIIFLKDYQQPVVAYLVVFIDMMIARHRGQVV